jgi:hypothetical protein
VPDVEGSWYFRPAVAQDGRERWNVYPMLAVGEAEMELDGDRWRPVTGAQPETMPWPFLKAPTAIPADPQGAGLEPAPEPAPSAAVGGVPSGPDQAPASGPGGLPGAGTAPVLEASPTS